MKFGAGAFVCGEETALINSIEGQRGEPNPKPTFPSKSGLYGKPTLINNVETYANIPVIISKGAKWFNSVGTEKSKGTKVFALAGKVNNIGLVEVPKNETIPLSVAKNTSPDTPSISISNTLLLGNGELLLSKR